MAGLLRKTLFQFASGASNNGVFGTAQLGTKVLSNDPAVIQGISGGAPSTAWIQGWLNATISSQNLPPLEEMQGVQFVETYQLCYLLARGLPEYDTGTTYNIGDITRPAASSQLYMSLINANLGNALPSAVSNSNWKYLGDLSVLAAGSGRIILTGNTTYYVATTGNDSTGNGTSGNPWLTIQHALNVIQSNVDLAGFIATVNVASGTYTTTISLSGPFTGGGSVVVLGNNTTPSNCIISTSADCLDLAGISNLNFQGFQLTSSGGRLISVSGSFLVLSSANIIFGSSPVDHVFARDNSTIYMPSTYSISGAAPHHLSATANSVIRTQNATVTLSGALNFSGAFANSQQSGTIIAGGSTYTGGTITGSRYSVVSNGVIDTAGSGANYFPGSIAGSSATGGQYL